MTNKQEMVLNIISSNKTGLTFNELENIQWETGTIQDRNMGGLLSSLKRNGKIRNVSGGKNKRWIAI